MKLYHFNLGDSAVGPVGFYAVIRAESAEQAVERLERLLPDELPVGTGDSREYIQVYFNGQNITVEDIDEVQPE